MKKILTPFIVCVLISMSTASFGQGGEDFNGLHGYISSSIQGPIPPNYNAGISFYAAIWRLLPMPIAYFQIGLPGTWVTPDNSDDISVPLCPIGTYGRTWWTSTTYDGLFQTLEGGPGYWQGNHFLAGPPKFMPNGTTDCYTNEVATPGWSFFYNSDPLSDNALAIAQISNHILMPPDGMTFKGEPKGDFLGFSYMALPLTGIKTGSVPVGPYSWTLFVNAANFKGPVAFYVPDAWARVASDYSYAYDTGRGLDSRLFRSGTAPGPAMEINTVTHFLWGNSAGDTFSRIPALQFPVDTAGKTVLVRDYMIYSKQALYDSILSWRAGGPMPTGAFDTAGIRRMKFRTDSVDYRQDGKRLFGINTLAMPTIFNNYDFGLKWSSYPSGGGMTKFPEYFKQTSTGSRYGIDVSAVPGASGLTTESFTTPDPNPDPYVAPLVGAWASPGPAKGPYTANLADGSTVTYYWYRFIDQPVFKQFNWSTAKKDSLQHLIEQMHTNWGSNRNYMPDISSGSLVNFDTALLVTPPFGYTTGYVPIVTRQAKTVVGKVNNVGNDMAQLVIYPNPTTGPITIQSLYSNGIEVYTLTDIVGKELQEVEINPGLNKLDISMYPTGIYLLLPQQAGGKVYKLSKQ